MLISLINTGANTIGNSGGVIYGRRIQKILEQQLKLLSEESKLANSEDLCKLTDKMINLVLLLDPELQNQFSAAQFSHFPALAMLSVQDLTDLHFGRYAHKNRPDIFRQKLECQG